MRMGSVMVIEPADLLIVVVVGLVLGWMMTNADRPDSTGEQDEEHD